MKTRKLLLTIIALFCLVQAKADVVINQTTFPDAAFRSFVKNTTVGEDGILTEAELSAIKKMNANNKGISNLKGVEYFKALTTLNCTSNQLTSLDVSKNTELKVINCSSNQLTSLDVSKNTALVLLQCDNNQLTSLDVSKNTSLTALYCYSNQIKGEAMEALFSSLPSVLDGELRIFNNKDEGNKITIAQVDAAIAKGWIPYYYNDSDWASYAGSSLDIEINDTNFPDDNFRNNLLAQNYGKDGIITNAEIAAVKSMDISGKDISNLKGIGFFTALTTLNCRFNQLTSLDISNNTALTTLNCSYNPLTSLDVSNNTALTTLSCSGNSYLYKNRLTSLDVSKNTALTSLDCCENQLTSLDVSKNTALTTLNCCDNQLTSLDVSKNTSLTVLYCYSNQIKGEAMDVLVASLPSVTNGELVIIRNDQNEGNAMNTLQVTIAKSKGWRTDYTGKTEINETRFPDAIFRNYLKEQTYGADGVLTGDEIATIKSIDVSGKGISNLKGIEFFTELNSLYCYSNQIKGEMMDVLVASLPRVKNGELRIIYNQNEGNVMNTMQANVAQSRGWLPYYFYSYWGFNNNYYSGWDNYTGKTEINETNFPDAIFRNYLKEQTYGADGVLTGDEIAKILTIDVSGKGILNLEGIEFFTALTKLYCDNNKLTKLDVSKNTALTGLFCGNNQLTSLDLSKNKALTELSCSYNQLKSLDISKNTALKSLACWNNQLTSLNLSKNTALTGMRCSNNPLTSLDLSKNTKLTSLSCDNNQLTSLDLSKNTKLTSLDCSCNHIKGEEMDALITSLPRVTNGNLYITNYQNEGNTITLTQIDAAIAKGWNPSYSYKEGYWMCYNGSGSDIEINKTRFPDENFRNYLLDQDYGKDGIITTAEISEIKKIEVDNKHISNLKGIEYFTALTSLSCDQNQLTSLDVSKNTKLTSLSCEDNQLTSLDVSKNTELTSLYCNHNQLTSLDLSKNTKLKFFYCYKNQLTSLDVSKNTALTSLLCSNNQLTSLDVSKNTELTSLYCDQNQLTSLDVSKNTKLTFLACDQNQLTSLDVSKNTELTGLLCSNNKLSSLDLSKNTALARLRCEDNQLTALDVSKNTALTELNCCHNQLTSLDLSNNTKLTDLSCFLNQIKGEAMDVLIASLPTVENRSLGIIYKYNDGNEMTTVQAAAAKAKGWIPQYYDGSKWKEYAGSAVGIEINETNFPDKNFRNYLKDQSYGSDLVITDEEIADISSMDVIGKRISDQISNLKGIEYFTALTKLDCHFNQLTTLDVSKNTKLTSLICGDNQLTSLDVSKNTALTSLSCSNNQLTELDVSKNTALTSLSCYYNQLSSLDVSKNTALENLDCCHNQLTSLDVSKNTALKLLICHSNQIKGETMDAFVESLPTVNNSRLQIIFNENEGNEMTTVQVDAAKAKGWIPQYYDGSNWTEYAGTPVEFKLTYMLDGEEYKIYDIKYGATITPEAAPKKETYRFSGWSEIPKTMPAKDVTITGTFERYYDIGNVVKLINFVTNGNATTDDVELYDQNSDGELNIGDIILVVKWILNNDNNGPSNSRTRSYDMPDWTQYTAAQFDVKTTADTNIRKIKLVKSMEQTHQMMYKQKDAYTYTVVVYSLSNQLMKPENGGIVEIDTENGSQNGLSIENVIVALPTGETQSYSSGQTATNIQQIEGDGGPTVVYDLKGNRMNANSSLKKGVYIVNGKKVIVK